MAYVVKTPHLWTLESCGFIAATLPQARAFAARLAVPTRIYFSTAPRVENVVIGYREDMSQIFGLSVSVQSLVTEVAAA